MQSPPFPRYLVPLRSKYSPQQVTGIQLANWEGSRKINTTRKIEIKPREKKQERKKTATLHTPHEEK